MESVVALFGVFNASLEFIIGWSASFVRYSGVVWFWLGGICV
jgi:hypothetical protein